MTFTYVLLWVGSLSAPAYLGDYRDSAACQDAIQQVIAATKERGANFGQKSFICVPKSRREKGNG